LDIRKKPATKWKIPLYKVHVEKDDVNIVSKVIKRGSYWAIGPEIEEFEKKLADYIGTDFCVSFNSGTSAGHAALISTGVKPNDQIIVPSFTFISTANWVKMVNAKLRFCDIEEKTLGMNPEQIKKKISKKTKVIMPVHYAGLPCQINEIAKIAKSKKILLIEDAAEAIGASVNNKKVGTFGDLAIFSFAGNKVLTTGEGGAITTNSKKIYEKLKLIRSHGRLDIHNYFSSIEKPNYVSLGYNWRMSSITAAIGISQLAKIEKLLTLRRKKAKYLSTRLEKFEHIRLHEEPKGFTHAFQLYSIRLSNRNDRDRMIEFLAQKGIMSKVFFHPIHKSKFYENDKKNYSKDLQTTEFISDTILSLPMFPDLKLEEMRYMIDSIGEFFEISK
jgi:perosamine synthetase